MSEDEGGWGYCLIKTDERGDQRVTWYEADGTHGLVFGSLADAVLEFLGNGIPVIIDLPPDVKSGAEEILADGRTVMRFRWDVDVHDKAIDAMRARDAALKASPPVGYRD